MTVATLIEQIETVGGAQRLAERIPKPLRSSHDLVTYGLDRADISAVEVDQFIGWRKIPGTTAVKHESWLHNLNHSAVQQFHFKRLKWDAPFELTEQVIKFLSIHRFTFQ